MNGWLIKISGWDEPGPIRQGLRPEIEATVLVREFRPRRLNGRTARAARVRSVGHKSQELLMIKINAQLWMPS